MAMDRNPEEPEAVSEPPMEKGKRPARTSPKQRGADGLTHQQRQAAQYLATGMSVTATAQTVGVDESTLRRWRRSNHEFEATVASMVQDHSDRVIFKLRAAGLAAIDAMVRVLADKTATHADKTKAAAVLLSKYDLTHASAQVDRALESYSDWRRVQHNDQATPELESLGSGQDLVTDPLRPEVSETRLLVEIAMEQLAEEAEIQRQIDAERGDGAGDTSAAVRDAILADDEPDDGRTIRGEVVRHRGEPTRPQRRRGPLPGTSWFDDDAPAPDDGEPYEPEPEPERSAASLNALPPELAGRNQQSAIYGMSESRRRVAALPRGWK